MWLVDISNTFTKCSLYVKGRHTKKLRLLTCEITPRKLQEIFTAYNRPEMIIAASVVPKVTEILKETFPNTHLLSGKSHLPILIDYPNPSEIGADRLANAIALYSFGQFPAIAVDFGTALTFDILDHRGAYVGGAIAPGLHTMLSSLHEKTALLPHVVLRNPPSPIGKNTINAIRSGVYYGAVGLIQNIIKCISFELYSKPKLIISTGGDGPWICKRIPEIQKNYPNLTLDGLRLYGESILKKEMPKRHKIVTKGASFHTLYFEKKSFKS